MAKSWKLNVILSITVLIFLVVLHLWSSNHCMPWNEGEEFRGRKMCRSLTWTARDEHPEDLKKGDEDILPLSMRITNGMIQNLTAPVPSYLPDLRNPCWHEAYPHSQLLYANNSYLTFYSKFEQLTKYPKYFKKVDKLSKQRRHKETERLRCLPSVYIIGFSKCGTTDLFKLISHHPDVAEDSAAKEPSFWTRPNFTYIPVTRQQLEVEEEKSFSDYLDLFELSIIKSERSKRDRLFIDASPSYIWKFDVWPNLTLNKGKEEPVILAAHFIKHFSPNAKFIIIVRNPTDRLYSGYLYREFGENSNILFHDLVVESISLLEDCLRQRTLRSCLYDPSLNERMKLRLRVGHYATFIEDWFNVFPREQFFITRLEDYSRDRNKTLQQITHFLDIDSTNDVFEPYFSKLNDHIFNQRRAKDVEAGDMLPKTRQMLNEHYSQSNKQLADLLNDQRFSYDDVN